MAEHDSFLDLNLDEVQELTTVKGGQEYHLKCSDAEIKESKGEKTAGQSLILVRFSIMDEPDTKQVTYPIMLPHESLDKEQNDNRKRQLKRMLVAMGFDVSQGFNIDELPGETVWAILDEQETADYGMQNNIVRFINPKESE